MSDLDNCHVERLTSAIMSLAREMHASRIEGQLREELKKGLLSLDHKLALMEKHIMSAISDYSAKQNEFNRRQGEAIDSAVASLNGLTADVQTLNDKITELQNSTGGVTPEDQALIDALETAGEAAATKAETLATALKTLDDATPPKPPTG